MADNTSSWTVTAGLFVIVAFAFTMPETGSVAQSTETLTAVTMIMGLNGGGRFRHLDLQIPYANEGNPVTDVVFTPANVFWTNSAVQ